MKKTAVLVLLSALAVSLAAMADPSATVTVAVNDVTRGSSKVTGTETARIGSKVTDGQYLKTGVKSRAELQFANLTITRLGANTIFDYSPSANEIDLQAGTILFSKPKDSAQMTIKTASVTAAILGTTGFVQVHGKTFIFGLIEGHAKITIGGVTYTVGGGDILRFNGSGAPQMFAYNVPHFLETSPMIVDFNTKLPNQAFIDHEVAAYDSLVARGFITHPTHGAFTDVEGAVPTVPTYDSAGAAHYVYNVQNEPATLPIFGPTGVVQVPARPQFPYDF